MSMSRRTTTSAIATLAGLAIGVAAAGSALAISGGGYTEHNQGCHRKAAANNRADRRQPAGCHDTQLLVTDRHGHSYVEAGTTTTRAGRNVHRAGLTVSPDGSGDPTGHAGATAIRVGVNTHYQPLPPDQCGLFDIATYPIGLVAGGGCRLDPTKWRLPARLPRVKHSVRVGKQLVVVPGRSGFALYFGANDGLDSGEHDEPDGRHGTSKEQNGPSDGGAVQLRWHPGQLNSWLPLVLAGVAKANPAALATDPFPLADAGAGACADGLCVAGQSHRRVAWRGGGKGGKRRDAYDYTGKQWDPYDCSGQSVAAEKKCHDRHHKNADSYYRDEAKQVVVEPGLQVYEDPDPNGSPLLPTYPLPAGYAGSCGVTVGGGPLTLPSSPVTNRAGQLSLSPSHC